MRKWVLIGIAAIAAAGVIGYSLVQLDTSETPPGGVSPTAGSVRSNTVDPSPNASPSSTPSSSPSPSPSPTRPSLSGPVLSAGGQRAASDLESRTGCSDDEVGRGFADLTWTPATQRGQEQKLQVTIFREGFESGNFKVSEALTPDRASYRWTPEGQAIHQWRVLTRHSDGWVPSETARFEGPSCVGV